VKVEGALGAEGADEEGRLKALEGPAARGGVKVDGALGAVEPGRTLTGAEALGRTETGAP